MGWLGWYGWLIAVLAIKCTPGSSPIGVKKNFPTLFCSECSKFFTGTLVCLLVPGG